ncbi:alpha/beta fold hydrolase [Rhodococcoides kyotonense]|uniref:3-oxoadipate enol-lactonase/3-oxoadipate enol-lactonase / 4-carboxymuconolactone decarboxylase n=1 Tax=Rhodococcoides kyotonense TaxID=398843 RepID=A0A239M117_9NOCA|nr:3-oxoadipate enol-lactonase/3-oxoadipate enol-lactonase / 4-carboxymuconolactone decarboxylase [Rhodococcus kyotonensis]
MMVSTTSQAMDLGSACTLVHRYGTGDAASKVIGLHSLGLDGRSFGPLGLGLAETGEFETFAPDLRGHGASDAPVHTIDLGRMAADVVELARQLRGERVHLVGTSMGSVVARIATATHPEMWSSVTLIAGPPTAVPGIGVRGNSARRSGMAAVVDETLARWFSGHALAGPSASVEYAAQVLREMNPESWAASWAAMESFATPGPIPTAIDTLCIAGEDDVSTPPAVVAELARVSGSKRPPVVIAGGTHQLLLDHADEIAALLQNRWREPDNSRQIGMES